MAEFSLGSICTGGGFADLGFRQSGFKPEWGIEYDRPISDLCKLNLGHDPFQDLLTANPRKYQRTEILHASPTCTNFSGSKINRVEIELDRLIASKIAEFVEYLRPTCLTLENVPEYIKSDSYRLILLPRLKKLGYKIAVHILESADYGVPQNRERVIIIASEQDLPLLPLEQSHAKYPQNTLFGKQQKWVSIEQAFRDLVHSLPSSELTDIQASAIAKLKKPWEKFLIQRIGHRNRKPHIRCASRPAWTIKASIGDDFHGGNRNKVIDYVCPSGIYSLNARALARLQSIPDTYQLPPEVGANKLYRAIGNGVPPLLTAAIGRSILASNLLK
jgi:DNA (cytosine-5)-methyltransferase 1